jgi:hypothetical protein
VRRAAFPLLLFLFGFVLGLLCLFPIHTGSSELDAAPLTSDVRSEEESAPAQAASTSGLLLTAARTAEALKAEDYMTLGDLVHPERGLTFSAYSTVELSTDQNFTADEIRGLAENTKEYVWGYEDGRGAPIRMTMEAFVQQYIFAVDYTQAPEVGVDQVVLSGNALENVAQAYPGCRFVDLCYPELDPDLGGMDWCSLKLVFAPFEGQWRLVGLIHSQWTI